MDLIGWNSRPWSTLYCLCMFLVHVSCDSIFNQYGLNFAKNLILSETFKSSGAGVFYTVLKYHSHIIMRTLDPQIILFLSFLSKIILYSTQSFLKQDFIAACICSIGGNKISEPRRERNLWGLGLLVSSSVGQASLERGTGQGNFRGHGGGTLWKLREPFKNVLADFSR